MSRQRVAGVTRGSAEAGVERVGGGSDPDEVRISEAAE
jgi:hypothetical protein